MLEEGKYGYFDPEEREYVITRPQTPTPWINYLGGGEYGGIVSNNGGGYSFDRDPRYKRVLRYRYNAIPEDQPGRYIYLRDDESGAFWSATWQPVKAGFDHYQCRHGLGYTVISQRHAEIGSELTYFVPLGKKLEFWWLKLRNHSQRTRRISSFSYAEFCFFDAAKDQQNVDWVQQIQRGVFEDNIIFWNAFMRKWDDVFMTASLPASSFDTSRESFVGRYRDLTNPAAVEAGRCSGSVAQRGNGVGALHHQLELAPGATLELVYVLGVTSDPAALRKELPELLGPGAVDRHFAALRESWRDYLATFQAVTPVPELNLMLNTWNPYQCKTTFDWSRFVSLYQLGIDRGMGFRDCAQDLLGVVHALPDQAKKLLRRLFQCQFADGHAYHLFYPLTGEGTMGEAEGGKYNWYSDDHLWLIEATVAYLKETGDLDFLAEPIGYAGAERAGTVWEHLLRALEFTAGHRGEHGLPLNGFADWNDALNLDRGDGRAESVWTGMLYHRELNLLIELAEHLGKSAEAARLREAAAQMKAAINDAGWDGEWYRQAFDDQGGPVGSQSCGAEEQIYLNPQAWAVLSGVADAARAGMALSRAKELLGTEFGLVLLYPAYRKFRDDRGGVSTYPPGAKENGGIFVHTNPWFIIAELMLGLKNEAFRDYQRILPVYKNAIPDRHEVEPYVYCQNILGKEHPQFGLGRNSWLTGTATWAYVAGTQYLLGIRPHYDGLIIDPQVPDDWPEFTVRRRFRGRDLEIGFRGPVAERGIFIAGERLTDPRFIPLDRLQPGPSLKIRVHY
ncbi:cellobiose phosphorylase [Hydrogenispora ethanolica]|uniref:Cellobiose phosphorylase n=1 Tax=Hydrogenispora ethanolica TaxID=1082276 RepID=A0A4R1S4R3_HYDET|nr:glycosyl transferase [Hydrogenispora ethanolica]TCL74099.1 cellobiose phosphorylase [Hydrogenispora ethanolica]